MALSKHLVAISALGAFAFIQCGGDQKPAETPASETAPTPAPSSVSDAGTAAPTDTAAPAASASAEPAAPAAPALSDEQIAAITDAANTAEIEQAKVAESKSKNADVKKFAAMMIKHHGEAKAKQAKLKLQPADSSDSTALKTDASTTLDTLKKSPAKDFDKAYIDAQVDGHQKVLDAINQKLLPNVKSPELKAYLDEIKPRVEAHLKEAKEIQQKFESKSSSVGGSAPHAG